MVVSGLCWTFFLLVATSRRHTFEVSFRRRTQDTGDCVRVCNRHPVPANLD